MKASPRFRAIVTAGGIVAIGISIVAEQGLWRKIVSDNLAWRIVRDGDAYPVYLQAATDHFGTRTLADETYKQWAVDFWKTQPGVRTAKQNFLTNGIIFELSLGSRGWRIDRIIDKEGGPAIYSSQ